jgi:hypothetical protein
MECTPRQLCGSCWRTRMARAVSSERGVSCRGLVGCMKGEGRPAGDGRVLPDNRPPTNTGAHREIRRALSAAAVPRAGLHKNGTRPPPAGQTASLPCPGLYLVDPVGEVASVAPPRAPQKQRPAHPGRPKTAPSAPWPAKTTPSAPWPAKNSAQRTLAVGKMPATAGPVPDLVGPVESVAAPAPAPQKQHPAHPGRQKKSAARPCLGACV